MRKYSYREKHDTIFEIIVFIILAIFIILVTFHFINSNNESIEPINLRLTQLCTPLEINYSDPIMLPFEQTNISGQWLPEVQYCDFDCFEGFEKINESCVDIDECPDINCDNCINYPGSYYCNNNDTTYSSEYDYIYNTYPKYKDFSIYSFMRQGSIADADYLLNNKVNIPRYPIYDYGNLSWDLDPYDEKYWRFIFYSLRPTTDLLYAYDETGDKRYFDKYVEIIDSFTKENSDSLTYYPEYDENISLKTYEQRSSGFNHNILLDTSSINGFQKKGDGLIKENNGIEFTSTNNITTYYTKQIKQIDLYKKQFYLTINVSDTENVDRFRMELSSDNFKSNFIGAELVVDYQDQNYVESGVLTPLTFSLSGFKYIEGNTDISKINSIRFVLRDKSTVPVKITVNNLFYLEVPNEPIVTFTFDDGHETQYSVAKKVLDKYDFKGTVYVIPYGVGRKSYLTLDQLKEMQSSGWEISPHYQTDLTTISPDELENVLISTKVWFVMNNFSGSEDFAYPLGEFKGNETNVLELSRKYFRSARTINAKFRETIPPSDYNKLRVQYVTKDTDVSTIIDNFNLAKQNNEWFIIVFHRLVNDPERNTEYSINNFEKIVKYIYASGVSVKNIQDVLDKPKNTNNLNVTFHHEAKLIYQNETIKNVLWDRHTVAFRSLVLVEAWWRLRDNGALTPELNKQILDSLVLNGHFLYKDYNFETESNHGISESVALFAISESFPDLPLSKIWKQKSLERFRYTFTNLYDEDGVLVENSPYYHIYSLKLHWDAYNYMKSNGITDPVIDSRLNQIIAYVPYILQPNLYVPTIGSSLLYDVSNVNQLNDIAKTNDELLYVLSRGSSGSIPSHKSLFLNNTGQTIMRSGWGLERDFGDETQLIFDIGDYRTSHSQLDALSFNLFGNGMVLLPDTGLYSYEDSGIKDYFFGTESHNTLFIEGEDQIEGSVKRGLFQEGINYTYQSGYHNLLENSTHKRAILLINWDLIIIIDKVQSTSFDFKQSFHISSYLKPLEQFGETEIYNNQTKVMSIKQLVPSSHEFFIGSEVPFKGWCSNEYEIKIPCYQLEYDSNDSSFVTIIKLGNSTINETSLDLVDDNYHIMVNNWTIDINNFDTSETVIIK